MPYILKQLSTRPGQSITFDFDQPVVKYMIGLNSFKLWFPKAGDDHWIQTVRVSLDFPDPPPNAIDKVKVAVSADMHDASGNHSSPEESDVTVACVAYTGGPNAPLMGIKRNVSHQVLVEIDWPRKDETMGVMSGFHLGYKEGDHQIEGLEVSAGRPRFHSTKADMWYPGQGATLASVDVGYHAVGMSLRDEDEVFYAENLSWVFSAGWMGRVNFKVPVKEVIAMLQNFLVSYYEPHNVLSIEATAGQCQKIGENGQVDMSLAAGWLRDGSRSREKSLRQNPRYWIFATS